MPTPNGELTAAEHEAGNARRLLHRIMQERAKGVRAHLLTDEEAGLVTVGLRALAGTLDGGPDGDELARRRLAKARGAGFGNE